MDKIAPKPYFFIPETDPRVKEYRDFFMKKTVINIRLSFDIGVKYECVREDNIGYIGHLILALQHYPNRIFSLVHGINPKFLQPSNDIDLIPEKEWKTDAQFINWFSFLGRFTISPFFMKSPEKRCMCLFADMLPAAYFIHANSESNPMSELNPQDTEFINNRAFEACMNFWVYCNCSKCNSKTPIESLINQFKLNFNFEKVSTTAEKLLAEGHEFKITRSRKL